MIYFLVGIGAFFGAILRFILSSSLAKIAVYGFPLGTLSVNLIGCFLIGIFPSDKFCKQGIC
jgi:CrcB protein